jgi:UDP-N-acetylglucosamine 2-epimerase (non-hydrolysing)
MKNKPLLICFGTRPEWLKIKPLIDLLDISEYKLFFTGQHQDLLKEVEVDYKAFIAEDKLFNRLDEVVKGCLDLPEGDFRGVLVQGDTASAFGCALGAYHRKWRIYYLEAGLRSYDLNHPYPEEGYRQMIARLADVNFAPTTLSKMNLINERVWGETFQTGNTVLDNLVKYEKGNYEDKVLVTMHRRENHERMDEWFKVINNLAAEYNWLEFILPIHPNPEVQKHRDLLTFVNVIEPMTHDETIKLLRNCKLVISDSGGIQEEATFFGKRVLVCRKTTERPEGMNTNHLALCPTPDRLKPMFDVMIESFRNYEPCPYGDGHAAEKIKKILDEEIL